MEADPPVEADRVLWIDATAGASGDMLLGALVDIGVPIDVLQAALDPLRLGIALRAEPVTRSALGATKVHVDVPDPQTLRHLPEILTLLEQVDDPIERLAGAVFTRLAEAEAAVHRVPIEAVHFHEVGALDCIADIVGTVAGILHLGASHIVCSPLGMGSGFANTEHGRIPVPVPAVLELAAGVPSQAGPAPFESLTPTGAALLVSVANEWGAMPPLVIESTGVGAGTRDAEGHANVVRMVVGQGSSSTRSGGIETVQLEANVDDMDPRLWPVAIQAMLDAGADDAWVTPITMKKGRPAFTIAAMCPPERVSAVRDAVFAHTSTIGLRTFAGHKHPLERWAATVDVDGHAIGVKIAALDGRVVNRSVEWDDVVRIAQQLDRTPKDVLNAATERAAALDPDTLR